MEGEIARLQEVNERHTADVSDALELWFECADLVAHGDKEKEYFDYSESARLIEQNRRDCTSGQSLLRCLGLIRTDSARRRLGN